jgi:uncharacterized membrane-anchored protein
MRRTWLAVAVQLVLMGLVFLPPLLVRATGDTVYLETEKMDPRSLFRGHYVILGYTVAQGIVSRDLAQASRETGRPVYVTVTTDRPARFVAVGLERPRPAAGEACIMGRVRGWGSAVDFPQIAQYFAPRHEAHELEGLRGKNLLARVETSSSCNAVLEGLEPR